MKLKEHDVVVLALDEPSHGLQSGDIGAIVHVYPGARAYEVEFVTFSGKTAALVTLEADQVRPVAANEIAHVRELAT